jgi:hypothetical protein
MDVSHFIFSSNAPAGWGEYVTLAGAVPIILAFSAFHRHN